MFGLNGGAHTVDPLHPEDKVENQKATMKL